ncbi:hypothetical protein PoB_005676900 [Plakobranchus ocellatus]|uniref:Uncharacterized protein n=1 Tax=Plakobranchus ocellatus TaxID=259542 RepID=A0AAV4CGG3_9GAST|nr:hypothetical protein PoB_005676900 [Plakobranchus ocellatus]
MRRTFSYHGLGRKVSPDEIRRQPEYQYLTNWTSPKLLTQPRPKTANITLENIFFKKDQRAPELQELPRSQTSKPENSPSYNFQRSAEIQALSRPQTATPEDVFSSKYQRATKLKDIPRPKIATLQKSFSNEYQKSLKLRRTKSATSEKKMPRPQTATSEKACSRRSQRPLNVEKMPRPQTATSEIASHCRYKREPVLQRQGSSQSATTENSSSCRYQSPNRSLSVPVSHTNEESRFKKLHGKKKYRKGILWSQKRKVSPPVHRNGRSTSCSAEIIRHSMESVYKNILHLFKTDVPFNDDIAEPCSHTLTRLAIACSKPSEKATRFVDSCNNEDDLKFCLDTPNNTPDDGDAKNSICNMEYLKNNDSVNNFTSQKCVCKNNDNSNGDSLEIVLSSHVETPENAHRRTNSYADDLTSNTLQRNDTGKREKHVKIYACKGTERCQENDSLLNVEKSERSHIKEKIDSLRELNKERKDQMNKVHKYNAMGLETYAQKVETVANEKKIIDQPRRVRSAVIDRSNSNFDADMEKCNTYLRAQNRTFTQTSQYMKNTKHGLSHLSVHYSQTNTAHNDRVIMADLLRSGHTRNAIIGDSVYAMERRLYNRRKDPMKSTTFYDRFQRQPSHSRASDRATELLQKGKARTVADRAKERQERINRKNEELERGFPPRSWSLVEVGAKDIEHMLDTCRYLRVDIKRQPNLYGDVDSSHDSY